MAKGAQEEEQMYPRRRWVRQSLRLGLLVTLAVSALSACGGGAAGGDGGAGGGGGAEAAKEQAKARMFPDYGELPPGKYVTGNFEPAFSFRVVGKGWVVTEGSEPTLVEMSQEVAGPILAFLSAERVFNPNKVRELDSMPAPDDMVAWLEQHPYLRTGDPQAAAVGGVEGVRLDAVVASVPLTECGGNCLGLFTVGDRSYDWGAFEKEKLRFIVLKNVGGERVMVVVEAPAEDFEEFLPKAQEVIDTVEWKGA
jgi:hypothetical protein